MLNSYETREAVASALTTAFQHEGLAIHSQGASCQNTWDFDVGMWVDGGPASLELRGCKGGFVSCEVVPRYFEGGEGESEEDAKARHRERLDYGRSRWPQDGDVQVVPSNFLAAARDVIARAHAAQA